MPTMTMLKIVEMRRRIKREREMEREISSFEVRMVVGGLMRPSLGRGVVAEIGVACSVTFVQCFSGMVRLRPRPMVMGERLAV